MIFRLACHDWGEMWRKRDTPPDDSPEQVELSDELAWRVHENARSWIVQVDVKATAALAIEAVILGFGFTLVTNSALLANLASLSRWVMVSAFLLLLISVTLSTLVLLPRIKLRGPKGKSQSYLYFGDLRDWDKDELSATLSRNKVDEGEIADQVIKLSKIAWRKHVLLQWSLYLLLGGLLAVGCLVLVLALGLLPEVFGAISGTVDATTGATCP